MLNIQNRKSKNRRKIFNTLMKLSYKNYKISRSKYKN